MLLLHQTYTDSVNKTAKKKGLNCIFIFIFIFLSKFQLANMIVHQ